VSLYKLVQWTEDLNLSDFYQQALTKGFNNNSSQHMLVDCFRKEREWAVWILYYDGIAAGSVAAHSLDFLENSYRICARTCVLTHLLPRTHLRSLGYTCQQHQNATAQFFIPRCIEWAAGANKDLYITTHPSDVGSQRLVHNTYCPALEKTGALTRSFEHNYREHLQTFWKLNTVVFLEQLDRLPRW
jgi:hypothetical protein